MSSRATRLLAVCLAFPVMAALAHSPLESSTRAIAHDSTVELVLTVGMEGGARLLKDAPSEASQIRTVGPGFALPFERASQLFEISDGTKSISPTKCEVRTDGLEFNFLVEFARPADGKFSLRAVYVRQLPSSFKSSFILTDESANVLATRSLSQADNVFDVALPAPMSASDAATAAWANHVPVNAQPRQATTAAEPVTRRLPNWSAVSLVALATLLGGGLLAIRMLWKARRINLAR